MAPKRTAHARRQQLWCKPWLAQSPGRKDPKWEAPGASRRHWGPILGSLNFRGNTCQEGPAPPALACRLDVAAGSRGRSAQTVASPGCSLPRSQGWVTESPEGISTVLNSLCLYLYANDRTLRCKLNRNLVSKSCHFLMDTSVKPKRPRSAAKPQEGFQRPTCRPQAQYVLEILSHPSIYGQRFSSPR